jgi:hypothetical protein
MWEFSGVDKGLYLSDNSKYTSLGYEYINSSEASLHIQQNGIHYFRVAPSGTADTAISWTTAMTIENTGYVNMTGASQVRLSLGNEGTAGTNTANWIRGNAGYLQYNSASSGHTWEIGGTERMRITSTGNVLVGTNDTTVYNNSAGTTADNGLNLRGDGKMDAARYNAPPLGLNRTGTDGTLLDIRKDGTPVGSISVSGTGTLYNTGGAGGGIDFSGTSHTSATGASMTSEVLDDYEEGTWTATVQTGSGSGTKDGRYTKIGRMVYIDLHNMGTQMSGNCSAIGGLPFATSAGPTNGAFGGVITGDVYVPTSVQGVNIRAEGSVIQIEKDAVAYTIDLGTAHTARYCFSICYRVN